MYLFLNELLKGETLFVPLSRVDSVQLQHKIN